jgi:hypothetical protein
MTRKDCPWQNVSSWPKHMPDITIEQAIYSNQGSSSYQLRARSPGFLDEWLGEAERLCVEFGERPAGVACPECLFAQPFIKRHVAVVQVADRGRPDSLGFHFLILPRSAYLNLGGDPFLLAERFPADWSARDPLPVLSLEEATLPRRTVQELAAALEGPEAGPTLLGGAQALVDGGHLVFLRPAPDKALLRNLWLLLPTSTRADLWPATFAFSNQLLFDAVVAPPAASEAFAGHLTEQQAGDYPEGYYERNLQMAVEAGDQHELDALLARRSRKETWRLGWILVIVIGLLVVVGNLLTPPPTRPAQDGKHKVEQRSPAKK